MIKGIENSGVEYRCECGKRFDYLYMARGGFDKYGETSEEILGNALYNPGRSATINLGFECICGRKYDVDVRLEAVCINIDDSDTEAEFEAENPVEA